MIGRVTRFYSQFGVGIIAADDGRKFRFSAAELTNRDVPLDGEEVDFVVRSGRPAEIVPLSVSAWTAFGGISQS
jgi:cold shock CspA family protein